MARRKPREQAKRNRPGATDRHAEPQEAVLKRAIESGADPVASKAGSPTFPNSLTQRLLVGLVVAHLGLLFLSYTAVVGASAGHLRWLSAAAPVLRTTHFGADGRPFYLAQGSSDEQPHRLQFATNPVSGSTLKIDAQTEWTTVEPSGLSGFASNDHYRRWMSLVATLAESDQPSLAAALLMPLVDHQSESNSPRIDAVRIVRLPTQLTTAVEDAAPPAYVARVVRNGKDVRLVSIQPTRLTTFRQVNDSEDARAGIQDAGPGEVQP